MEPGRLELRLGMTALPSTTTHVEDCPDLGPSCKSSPPPTAYVHHVDRVTAETALDASYGLHRAFALELHFPLRIVREDPSYAELDGAPKDVPDDIHHHKETLVGLSDPWLSLRAGGALGGLVTQAKLGLSVPIGSTQPNPYRLAEQGLSHEHTQFGSGTFEPIVGLGLSYRVEPLTFSASALALFSLYENGKGYRAPTRVTATLRSDLVIGGGTFRPYLAGDLAHQSEERWSGSADGEGSGARTDILLGGGLVVRIADPWSLDVGMRVRAATIASAPTMRYPGLVQVGVITHWDR